MMTAVSLENAIPSTVSFPTCFVKSDGTLLFDDISRGWNERLKIPPFLCLFQRCQQFGRVKRTVGSEVEPRAGVEPLEEKIDSKTLLIKGPSPVVWLFISFLPREW